MARDLKDSVDKLEATLRAVGTRVMTIGTGNANRKLDSFERLGSVKKRLGMIEAQSRIGKFFSVIKESDKLFAADAWMSAHPNNSFKSAADKVRFDEIVAERRKRDRMRSIRADKLFKEQMLAITDPDLAYRESLEEKFQGASQGSDIAADEIIRAERSEKAKEIHSERRKRDRMKNIRANQSFRFAMLGSDEQFIQGAMRDKGWSRDQAEQVYFKNLTENTKWLRFIAKDNPKIAKNLIPIAKTIGKASGLPIVGSFASNPALAAITATIGGFASVMNSANSANEVTKKWRNYENLYGKPTERQEWNARLAGIKDPARIAEIYGQLAVDFGGDPDMFLLSQGIALRGMDHKQKQLHAKAYGFTPDMVRLAEIYAGATPEESDIVDARIYALEREESEGWKSGSGFRKTLRSMQLKWIPFQKDLEARGWSWSKILALANPLMFGGQFVGNEIGNAVWDEVHDTAEIDDRYRAGMYDNSTTNNNGGDRSITVIQNISAEVKNEDPVGFVKEMTLLGGRGKHEAESVLQNNDSLRTN